MFKSLFTFLKRKKPQPGTLDHVLIWRDSVAAGDDVYAPHEIKVERGASLESILEKLLVTRYLPSIQGGKATWILVGRQPVAVLAQQWSKPHYLVESTTPIEDLAKSTGDPQFEFLYWCQVEPLEVVECIEQGKPWPDRYGRDQQE